jgi:hypothetical protein
MKNNTKESKKLKERKSSLNQKQRITVREIYLHYPHKWRKEKITNTVPLPYFPAKEISNHPYALEYQKWKAVVDDILETYVNKLLNGEEFMLPSNLGRIGIYKYKKVKRSMDFNHFKKTGEKVFIDNLHTDGFAPLFKWDKGYTQQVHLKYNRHWKCLPLETFWKKWSNTIMSDFSLIYNFNDL